MQGVHRYGLLAEGGVRLELTPTTTSPLALDDAESTEMRIQRLISENPVIIFSRSSCCMCHVMKRLLFTNGVHPTVIELEEDEIVALNNNKVASSASTSGPAPKGGDGDVGSGSGSGGGGGGAPALYIGGALVGGFESLLALHLSGHLVPKLIEVGVLQNNMVL